ncbi:MAG: phosphatidate cytidylyltransferase, partial [Eubacterium sp.]|nr:phosphatidate cytidylyltransferase [Eubacterium sp.]
MFVTRLLSGIVLVTAAVILLFFGDVWLAGALLILSQIGIFELLRVLRLIRHPMALVVYLETAAYYILLYLGLGWWTTGLLVLELVILLMIYVMRYPRDRIDIVAKCLFVSVYVTLLLSFIYQTRCLPGGLWLVWLIIIASWGSD